MRTDYCGKLRLIHINKLVTLCGWIHNIRRLKKIIFVIMRDCEGMIQIVFNNSLDDVFKKAITLRNEFCIQITGTVKKRNEKNITKSISTGEIEVIVSKLNIINSSIPLPLDYIKKNQQSINLKYRYLELRNIDILNNLKLRHKVVNFIHNFMYQNKFINIETPILTKSTPEGARDYLVPSRIHTGKFYALPQSPQLFKQLLMIAGIDRYYQIAKCFRDEDLRSDRQPEFTQIDMELSFVDALQVQKIVEQMICNLWLLIKNVKLEPFPTITFEDSMNQYGTDKPDLRNPIKMIDIKYLLKNVKFFEFAPLFQNKNNRIIAINIPKGSNLHQDSIENYQKLIKNENNIFFYIKNNIAFFMNNENNLIKKIFNKKIIELIINKICNNSNHLIFVIADNIKNINCIFHKITPKIGKELEIIKWNRYCPVWIINFPMFYKEKNGKFRCSHHPFSEPKNCTIEELKKNPQKIISNSYDIVINGYELGGGSVRINNPVIQKSVFRIIGITEKEQTEKFGFFIDALKYGTPIHAGIAIGLDRLIMLLTDNYDIKKVIAFPKTTSASCLMTNAPNYINNEILQELYIQSIQ